MTQKLRGMAAVATAVMVASLGVASPASAEPTHGTIAGHLADGGSPASGIRVFVSKTDGTAYSYSTTDSAGFYRTSELPPGNYKVEFDLPWGNQYAHQKLTWDDAAVIAIVAGAETVVNDSLLPTGSVSGRLTAQDGTGLAGVRVAVNGAGAVTTDASGDWQIPRTFARPDGQVHFYDWARVIDQYAYGKLEHWQADRIVITSGSNTVVNDQLLPTGSVRVLAKNALTGASIGTFGAQIRSKSVYTQTGEAILPDLPVGTHPIIIDANGFMSPNEAPMVTVTAGQQAEVTIQLYPPSVIETTVVDAATGLPLAGVCVAVVKEQRRPSDGCWDLTDAEGKIALGYLEAGKYQLIAFPSEAPGYGAQWVGANGGTGKQHRAVTITVGAGVAVAGPTVKMDRAGSLTGRVTTSTGAPAAGWAGVMSSLSFVGGLPSGADEFDADGRYTLDNLGPYDWQLFFVGSDSAAQFSGGVANRYLAKSVRVRAGATATYNTKLRKGTEVTTKVRGIERPYVAVEIYNAVTGDILSNAQAYPDPFTVKDLVIGPQFVKIAVHDGYRQYWYGGPDKAHAKLVWISGFGSKTIELDLS